MSLEQQMAFAVKLRKAYGKEIFEACRGTNVPQSWLAGIIGNENASLAPAAKRFEKGLYEQLLTAQCGGKALWNTWDEKALEHYQDADIRNLASSHGLTQILGLHQRTLGISLYALIGAGEQTQLINTVRLLQKTAKAFIEKDDFESVLRIWNTGSPKGKPFTSWYLSRGQETREAYETLLNKYPTMSQLQEAVKRGQV